jgi:hypothetical protein
MKKIILAVFAVSAMVVGYGQSDDGGKQTRQVSGFNGVDVSGGIDLYLSSGPESVAVSASSSKVRDHIITEVENGILHIHLENNWHGGFGNPKMKAYVSISKLKYLEASGGGDIYFENLITTDELKLNLSGGGDLKGKLNASRLEIEQSGGSSVDLTGNVGTLNLESSGGGSLKGYGLVTDYTTINASGGSDSELTVNKDLKVFASGGCDIRYKGGAKVSTIKTSGGGSVTHKD